MAASLPTFQPTNPKARAGTKFCRPIKTFEDAVQKFDFKYLFEPATSFYSAEMCDMLSHNEEGLLRLSLSNGAMAVRRGLFGRPRRTGVRLQSRSDAAAGELTKIYRCPNIVP